MHLVTCILGGNRIGRWCQFLNPLSSSSSLHYVIIQCEIMYSLIEAPALHTWVCLDIRQSEKLNVSEFHSWVIPAEREGRNREETQAQYFSIQPHGAVIEMPIEHCLKWKKVTFSVTWMLLSTTVKLKVLADVYKWQTRWLSNQRLPLFCSVFMASVTSEHYWIKGNKPSSWLGSVSVSDGLLKHI